MLHCFLSYFLCIALNQWAKIIDLTIDLRNTITWSIFSQYKLH
uniref:Uncharacterized protein n=1 Tax=Rhizophora mucronata TaxID=61149 RepID=A0A2P2PJU0_RHIMU